jgi:ParB-like chromosome segregation protein Spo0J
LAPAATLTRARAHPVMLSDLADDIAKHGLQNPVVSLDGKFLDGHNRFKICEKHGKKFQTVEVELEDRDHVKLWIGERQLGGRNLTDDQRSIIANEVREWRSDIATAQATAKARAAKANPSVCAKSTQTEKSPKRTSTSVAKEAKLPERKLRLAQEIKKVDPKLSEMVRAGEVKLVEAKKISNLDAPARKTAIAAVESGQDVRTAIRTAKKEDYNATIAAEKPKVLERIYTLTHPGEPLAATSI